MSFFWVFGVTPPEIKLGSSGLLVKVVLINPQVGDEEVHTFRKGISPKVNVIFWLGSNSFISMLLSSTLATTP